MLTGDDRSPLDYNMHSRSKIMSCSYIRTQSHLLSVYTERYDTFVSCRQEELFTYIHNNDNKSILGTHPQKPQPIGGAKGEGGIFIYTGFQFHFLPRQDKLDPHRPMWCLYHHHTTTSSTISKNDATTRSSTTTNRTIHHSRIRCYWCRRRR